jgi:hypothetical protein
MEERNTGQDGCTWRIVIGRAHVLAMDNPAFCSAEWVDQDGTTDPTLPQHGDEPVSDDLDRPSRRESTRSEMFLG